MLVLRAGAQQLALVDLDLIAPLESVYIEKLREAVRKDVSYVMVSAIHTHSGPGVIVAGAAVSGDAGLGGCRAGKDCRRYTPASSMPQSSALSAAHTD